MEEGYDAFLVKFNSSGVRQWGTYYGGTGYDYGYSCATDASGNSLSRWDVLIQLLELPQQALTKLHLEEGYDAFLVKFNSSGVRQWGTYYGGTGYDYGFPAPQMPVGIFISQGILDQLPGIATTGAHQTTYGGGRNDAFLVKFNSSGVRQWGTYYGGTG